MTDPLFRKNRPSALSQLSSLNMHRPIENCYWVIPGKLLAGEYPRDKDEESSRKKLQALLCARVKVFIDLTERTDNLIPYANLIGTAIHRSFPIRDTSIPASPDITIGIFDAVDHYLEQGQTVYVHCWGGVGRTGVIIGCWLARHGHEGRSALQQLRRLWQHCPKSAFRQSPETLEQEQYILNWRCGQ